jgi:hypothetical protein
MNGPRRLTPRAAALPMALVLLAISGCASDLDTYYGSSTRRYLSTSVNGVDVLAGMFADAGHDVSTRRILITSSMDKVQTIVWFPDDTYAPREEVCQWFDRWLASGNDRTLVYVSRNFDAASVYWRKMAPRAPKDQQRAYRERLAQEHTIRPGYVPQEKMQCEWFTLYWPTPQRAETLGGPWSAGIDAEQAEVYVSDQFESDLVSRRLLTAGSDTLVREFRPAQWGGGRLIAISNGSFLLNLPLVNHEHRKLAGRLIAAVGPPGRVVFLESGAGGPPIDPPAGESALARLFGAWPLNVILLHLAVLGIIFCFARWPIFGRPKTPPGEPTSDFAYHVEAVGELLARTHDRAFAASKLPEDPEAAKADAAGARL